MKFLGVIDRLVIEFNTPRNTRVLDAVPLETQGQPLFQRAIGNAESIHIWELRRNATIANEDRTGRHPVVDRDPGDDVVAEAYVEALAVYTTDAPTARQAPQEAAGQRPVLIVDKQVFGQSQPVRQERCWPEQAGVRVVVPQVLLRERLQPDVIVGQAQADAEFVAQPVTRR